MQQLTSKEYGVPANALPLDKRSAEADTEAARHLLRRDRADRRDPMILCGGRAVVEFMQQRHLLL